MPQLVSKKIKYTFSVDEIKNLLSDNLNVPLKALTVTYNMKDISDDRYDRYPTYVVDNISVTVDNTKI